MTIETWVDLLLALLAHGLLAEVREVRPWTDGEGFTVIVPARTARRLWALHPERRRRGGIKLTGRVWVLVPEPEPRTAA